MSIADIILSRVANVTGVEGNRVYIGPRYEGIYFDEPDEWVEKVRQIWEQNSVGHIYITQDDLALLELKQEVQE